MTEPTEQSLRAQWGSNVRRLRLEKGMSQTALADAAGLAQPHVSRIERGVESGSARTQFALARALGVEVHDLFTFPTTAEVAS
jgi:transcriptional regulator with XRE-family HTH domain